MHRTEHSSALSLGLTRKSKFKPRKALCYNKKPFFDQFLISHFFPWVFQGITMISSMSEVALNTVGKYLPVPTVARLQLLYLDLC